MSEQTMSPLTVGSWVWCKLFKRIWWPGKLVDGSNTPKDFQIQLLRQKKCIAIVYFQSDKSYECVTNMKNIIPYNCPKKLEFVKKGYLLFIKQKKGNQVIGNFKMAYFIQDVLTIERDIRGNIAIFQDSQKEIDHTSSVRKMIKESFVSGNNKDRKSLPPIITTPVSKVEVSMQKHSPSTSTSTSTNLKEDNYKCYYQKGCPFSSNRYDILKRHINMHKAEGLARTNNVFVKPKPVTKSPPKPNAKPSDSNPSTSKISQKSNKRKTGKKIKTANKKMKLKDEILRDWDDGDEENAYEDKVQNIRGEIAKTPSNITSSANKVDFDGKDDGDLNKERSITLSSVSSSLKSIVHELGDEIDTDVLDKLNESNTFMDEIKVQNSTTSYIENTSDQIRFFEKSNISCDVNEESDASAILIKNNKVIEDNGKMIMSCTSSNTYVKNDTDGLRNDDHMLVETRVEPNDNFIISNIKTSDDKGGIKQMIKKIPEKILDSAKKEGFSECLYDKLIKPNWMIEEKWGDKVPAVIEEAKRILTFDKMPLYLALPETKRMPQVYDIKLEPQPDYEVIPPSE